MLYNKKILNHETKWWKIKKIQNDNLIKKYEKQIIILWIKKSQEELKDGEGKIIAFP